jgi:hypothetical protein
MNRLIGRCIACTWLATAPPAAAADEAAALDAAAAHVAAHEQQIVQELRELLALPNVASDHAHIRVNAHKLVQMPGEREVGARILETPGARVSCRIRS